MASKIAEVIGKEKKVLNSFADWYTPRYNTKLQILAFFSLPFEYQLGIFVNFFEEVYNYSLHADRESIVIFYPDMDKAKDIIMNRPGKLLKIDNIEYTDFTSGMSRVIYNYEKGMIKIIELIVNPF